MTQNTSSKRGGAPPKGGGTFAQDGLASLVVFLVALPLCVGIAVACGVSPERGLVTGIIGGLVVGPVAGSPLLVSGPAASLIVPVNDLVQHHGIVALGPVVMLAGLWQVLAGALGLGQWFRAMAPAVITGMLVGIGVLISGSQIHVALDGEPSSTFLMNVSSLGTTLVGLVGSEDPLRAAAPLVVSVVTVALIVGWNRLRPARFRLVPGHFVSLLVVTLGVAITGAPVRFLQLSGDFVAGLSPVAVADLGVLLSPSVVGLSLVFAFVASAATLLTASAIDQRQTHTRTNYDRELIAQGAGNLFTGAVGGLPMTGVIVRSSVNVDAGAQTRWSTVLHGVWLLTFLVVAPSVLEVIPRASLGAILVFTGVKLVDVKTIRDLYTHAFPEFAICMVTLLGVVLVGLFEGLVLGFGAALVRLSITVSRFALRVDGGPEHYELHLAGSATFVRLPELARALEEIPTDFPLHVHVEELEYIDSACLTLLSHARTARGDSGRSDMVVEWDELLERRDPTFVISHGDTELRGGAAALVRVLWRDYKRLRHTPRPAHGGADVALPSDWILPSRMRLRTDAAHVDEVVAEAARLLSPDAGVSEEAIVRALSAASERTYISLGRGVGLPHAGLPSLDRPLAAMVTTRAPIDMEGEKLDVFFVVLGPESKPRLHLRALTQIARLVYTPNALAALRTSEGPDLAFQVVERSAAQRPSPMEARHGTDAVVLVVAIDGTTESDPVLEEVFLRDVPSASSIAWPTGATAATLRDVLGIPQDQRLLLVATTSREAAVYRALMDESSNLLPDYTIHTHLLLTDP